MEERDMITYPARPTNGGPVDKAASKYGDWMYEPKYNGWRALVHVPTGRMWNRQGEPLSITDKFDTALMQLKETDLEWADCEALERRHDIGKGSLIVFDTPMKGRGPTYLFRKGLVYDTRLPFAGWNNEMESLRPIDPLDLNPTGFSIKAGAYIAPHFPECEVNTHWEEMKQFNEKQGCEFYEGLVAKKTDSKYHIQLRSPNEKYGYWIKHRFKA